MTLSHDAITFGLAYLNGSRRTLSFGGDGAKMRITDRARVALSELLAHRYAEPIGPTEPSENIPGREHYRGADMEPSLGALAKSAGINPFDRDVTGWATFVRVDAAQ